MAPRCRSYLAADAETSDLRPFLPTSIIMRLKVQAGSFRTNTVRAGFSARAGVACAHPSLDRSELVFDRATEQSHRVGIAVELLDHGVDWRPCGSAMLQRTAAAPNQSMESRLNFCYG